MKEGEPPPEETSPVFRRHPSEPEAPDDLDEYLRRLVASLDEVPIPGVLVADGPLRVGFEALYVSPTLTVVRGERADGLQEWAEEAGDEERKEEGEERDRHIGVGETLSRHRRLIVVGGPGSGKTALLRYLALTVARRLARQRLGLEEGLLPVLVSAARLRAELPLEVTPRDLCLLAGWDGAPEAGEPIFARYLEQGRVFLLVDCPDGRGAPDRLLSLLAWAGRWTAAYPGIRCAVAADARAYEAVCPPPDFAEGWLDPSGPAAVEGMARRWFREVSSALRPSEDADRVARRRASGLMSAVRRSAGAERLIAVPGHLGRMALAHLHRSDLPGAELDLVRETIDVIASRPAWQDDLTPSERLLPAQRAALSDLMGRGSHAFLSAVQEALREIDAVVLAESWAGGMAAAGLIARCAEGGWEFADPLCRDYLAAREMCRTAGDAEALFGLLRQNGNLHLVVWCAGLAPDVTPILRAVLAQEETAFREALQMAAQCLTHGRPASESVRREICAALVGLCRSDGLALLRKWALDRLSEMGAEEVIPEFLSRLAQGETSERELACEALGRIGGPTAVAALSEQATHDPASAVRVAACRALGRIGSEVAAEPLARLALESEDAQVRAGACRALGRIGSERVLSRMTEALEDRRASVRGGAAFALGRIGSERVIPKLLEAMEDEYSSVRWRAIQALGLMRAEEALEPLREAMSDEDWAVRREACVALGRVGSGAALKPLTEALRDGYSSVRRAACEALSRIGAESAVSALVRSLKDEDWAVRRAACDALCHIRSDAAVEPLLRALRDKDAFVRAAGAEILGWVDKGRAADLLMHALRADEYSSVRRAACEALSRMAGDRYTEAVRLALKDPTSSVRRAALRGLCLRRPVDLPALLSRALGDADEEVREEACEALGGVGGGADLLLGALSDASAGGRRTACEALGRVGDAGCVTPLCGLLKDPEGLVRDAAFESLWRVCRRTERTVYLKDVEKAFTTEGTEGTEGTERKKE